MSTKTMVDMSNNIRSMASEDFRNAVPLATDTNVGDFFTPILSYTGLFTEYCRLLMQPAKIMYETRVFNNKLRLLWKGESPLGGYMIDSAINPAQMYPYVRNDRSSILRSYDPDIKQCFYTLNRQDVIPATISNEALSLAATSWQGVEDYITMIVNSMYSKNGIAEYTFAKRLVSDGVDKGYINTVSIAPPTDKTTSDAAAKLIKNYVGYFQDPDTKYNSYLKIAQEQGVTDPKPFVTWSEPSRLLLICTVDFYNTIGFESLASAYNLSFANFDTRVITVGGFDNPSIMALVCDEGLFQIYDHSLKMEEFYNPGVMEWNYYYHVWQYYNIRPYANAIAILSNAEQSFVPVSYISNVPKEGILNVPLTLTGTVHPDTATNKTITWSTSTPNATINDGVLTSTSNGQVKVTATVANGISNGVDFTQEVPIVITG